MKVALVCDWLTEIGGAEDVLMEFHKMFPDAPIYTSQYRKGRIDWFKDAEVKTGWLQYFPIWSRRLIAPLRQKYFENLDLNGYDLVISITGCDAKFIKTTGKHICFCHAATQYYWGKYDEYLKNPGFGILNPLARLVFKRVSPKLRKKDFDASKNPDEYITVSNFTKKEIKRFYKREAKVVNPPVNVGVFAQAVDNYNTKKGKSQTKISHNKTIKMQISQAIKNEQKFCTDLKNVENLDQISIRGENLYDLEYNREMNSDCRKIIHKSFIDNGKVIMYKDVNNIFGYETIYKNYNGRNKKNNNNRYTISGSQSIKDINSYTFK